MANQYLAKELRKKCNQCNREKPISEYYPMPNTPGATYNKCIACQKLNRNSGSKPPKPEGDTTTWLNGDTEVYC